MHGADKFRERFTSLTGNAPLPWQERLYRRFLDNDIPSICDLPTGLGKTMVMAIWLIARSVNEKLPRRLIYVVDRRTVVDQATDLAVRLRDKLRENEQATLPTMHKLAVSTLRGQLADNREWTSDLSRPAIVIGTVDLIGSGLLFSGYRSSFKRKPLEAGLIGQDSLLVLDEAHLSKPFDKLLAKVEEFQQEDLLPMRVLRMSATSGKDKSRPPFTLLIDDKGNLTSEDAEDAITVERFNATKRLAITTLGAKDKLTDKLADEAVNLSQDKSLRGKRIVVFVRKPDDAKAVAKAIRERAVESVDDSDPKPKKVKNTRYVDSVEVLTGTMRGLERDELVKKPILKRLLDGDEDPDHEESKRPVFLISTSAGEVGFDLNADHLVGDEAPLDSWIQRLGRVNRRGKGIAIVQVIAKPPAEKKKEGDAGKHTFGSAAVNAIELLKQLPEAELLDTDERPGRIFDASPCALRNLAKPDNALSPNPPTVELTDILLDAWSMTSIFKPLPGRPPVDSWLRGIADWEPARTEIAWRAELDLDGFANLDPDDIEEWFDTHRIRAYETLGVKTSDAATWFGERWEALSEAQRHELATRPVIVDRAGLEVVPLGKVIDRLSRKSSDADAFLRGAEVIVPASLGGIRRGVGLLDSSEPKLDEDEEKKTPDEQKSILEARRNEIDVADVRGRRYRAKIVKPVDGEAEPAPLVLNSKKPAKYARYALELESDDEKTVRLVSYVPSPARVEIGSKPQTLEEHVRAVRKAVDDILSRLALPDAITQAAQLAADWHDHGKARERWQRLLVFPKEFVKPDEPMGKSGREMKRDPRGYRHEFGSLRELTDAFNAGDLIDDSGKPVSQEVFDLSMHLIATHHGRGRPHFPKGGFDPDCEVRSDEIHTDAIRRFGHLLQKHRWWRLAWLESLLRCADALASADQEAGDGLANAEGGEQ